MKDFYTTLKSASILYVEDNKDAREELTELLSEDVGSLDTAEDGEKGLELFKIRNYDAVISDVDMPKLDGLAMSSEIKKISPETPIILTTAFNEPELLIKAINIGIDRYIGKPIDVEELLNSIYKVVYGPIQKKRSSIKDNIIKMVLDDSPEKTVLFKNKTIEFANGSFLEFFNFNSLEELQTKANSIESFISLINSPQTQELENILSSNSSLKDDVVITVTDKNGAERKLSFKCTIYDEVDTKILTFIDVTKFEVEKEFHRRRALLAESEHKKTKETLEIQSRRAEMGEMINAIAHQWRQPLNTLSMLLGDLTDSYEFGEMSEYYIKSFYKSGINQIDYMNQTIEDFRTFFRDEKKAEIFKPSESIDFVLRLFVKHYQQASINFKFEIIDSNIEVIGFKSEFNQVVINILNNARDAFIERKREDREINISIVANEDKAKILIGDNAGGIEKEVLPKIFDPYITTKGDNGTGIGLNMSKNIIENMNGSIEAESNDKGAIFIITLPLKRS